MSNDNSTKKPCTFRLDEPTRQALEKKADELGTSQANAIGVLLGAHPETAYAKKDFKGKLITR